jgi:hypothetical protein
MKVTPGTGSIESSTCRSHREHAVATALWAKGDMVLIELKGKALSAPIKITDAKIQEFNVWAGPGVNGSGLNEQPAAPSRIRCPGARSEIDAEAGLDQPSALRAVHSAVRRTELRDATEDGRGVRQIVDVQPRLD